MTEEGERPIDVIGRSLPLAVVSNLSHTLSFSFAVDDDDDGGDDGDQRQPHSLLFIFRKVRAAGKKREEENDDKAFDDILQTSKDVCHVEGDEDDSSQRAKEDMPRIAKRFFPFAGRRKGCFSLSLL